MKKVILGVVALYVVGLVAFTLLTSSARKANAERSRAVLALGAKHVERPKGDEPLLKDACKGKLEPGGPTNIIGYTTSRGYADDDHDRIGEMLVGTSNVFSLTTASRHLEDKWLDRSMGEEFKDALNPVDWGRHLTNAKHGSPDVSGAKYLVVATYGSLTLPLANGNTFSPGSGEYLAQVLTFPEGTVVCEGRGEAFSSTTVRGSGKTQLDADLAAAKMVGFSFALRAQLAPLRDVCDAGGAELCKVTSGY